MNSAAGRLVATAVDLDSNLPLQRVYRWEREKANATFLTQPNGGQARDWTWSQAMNESRRMAAYLRSRNWPPGSHIALISKNCAWWLMAELAIWMSGHTSVPIYPSLSASAVRTLLLHCGPVACFVGAVDDELIPEQAIPDGVRCIRFPTAPEFNAPSWDDIISSTMPLYGSPVRKADAPATLIYTSGTTGNPKGALHRFESFTHFANAVLRVVGENAEQRLLSYLPLAHIAERALVEATAFHAGFHVFFVENISTFREDLRRARPTVFFSVPRLLVKFQQGVTAKVPQAKLNRLLRIPLVNRVIRRRILEELGLDSVRLAASGGAALPLATLRWFRSIGLNLVEGYGMTETGITHTPVGGQSKPGFVGDAIPGVETKISEDGEVLVRSPMNMIGYYNDPGATRETFTSDGFFRTGDLGELDADGWLRISGRIKEQFKTSKGKYVLPTPIEQALSEHPLIEACCVMGSGAPKPFAIVVLSAEAESPQDCEQPLSAFLDKVNHSLEAHERLQFLVVTQQPWTVGNGLLTPTMKIKRSVLEHNYSRYFEEWTRRGTTVVWHRTVG